MCKSKKQGGTRCLTHRVKNPLEIKNQQIEQKSAHLAELKALPTNGELRKRIIRLEGTLEGIIRKRDALQQEYNAHLEAEKQKQEQAELDRKQQRKVKNEDEDVNLETDLKVLLTEDEREEVEEKRGELSVGDYLIRTALHRDLQFNPRVRALAELDMRKVSRHRVERTVDEDGNTTKTQLSQGRMPTEDATIRDKHIKIQNGLKNRTAAAHYLNVMAAAYGLSANAYIRMRALGKDMYQPEAHLSDESNKYRLRHQMKMEHDAGITVASSEEEILEARKRYDREVQEKAWKSVETKFGAAAVAGVRSTYTA